MAACGSRAAYISLHSQSVSSPAVNIMIVSWQVATPAAQFRYWTDSAARGMGVRGMGVGDLSTCFSQAPLIHLSIISAFRSFPAQGNGPHPGAHLPADLGKSLTSEAAKLLIRSLILDFFKYLVEHHKVENLHYVNSKHVDSKYSTNQLY